DLLDEPHRRLVRRTGDQDRRRAEHEGGDEEERGKQSSHFNSSSPPPRMRLGILGGGEFQHHSVINGSNVQSASVTNTASNAVSRPIHIIAIASSGGDARSADVPRTPAIITGIAIGYKTMGSSTSRVRARTSIAANSVPTAAKPSVPDASSATSSAGRAKSPARHSSP